MKKTCFALDGNNLVFNGATERVLGICCEVIHEATIPGVELADTPEENFKNWGNLLAQVREESDYDLCDRKVSKACFYCLKYLPVRRKPSAKIMFVNISMYTSPCQSGCIYCGLRENGYFDMTDKENVAENYRKVIDLCNYLKENNRLDDEAAFQISAGEIAIHPFKDELLDAIGDVTTTFVSNGMKFDEGIAIKLSRNPKSRINVSLDCGTTETWKTIKRRNNFHKTLENLAKYKEYITRNEQLELKYIVMPGINTSDEDFNGIIEIMKTLGVFKLIISRDYNESSDKRPELKKDLERLVENLIKNDLDWEGHYALSFEELNDLTKLDCERETKTICKLNNARIGAVSFPGYTLVQLKAINDTVLVRTDTYNFEKNYCLEYFGKTLEEFIELWEIKKAKLPGGITLEIETTTNYIVITTVSNYDQMARADLNAFLAPNAEHVSLLSLVENIVNKRGGVFQEHSRILKRKITK